MGHSRKRQNHHERNGLKWGVSTQHTHELLKDEISFVLLERERNQKKSDESDF